MTKTKKFFSIFSILLGIIIVILGLFSIIFYIKAVVNSTGQADQSIIYWGSIFLLYGIISIVIIGGPLILLGILALKNNSTAYKIIKIALIIALSITLIFFIEIINTIFNTNKMEHINIVENQKINKLQTSSKKIEQVQIENADQNGFDLLITTTKGIGKNPYILKIDVKDTLNNTNFLVLTEQYDLDENDQTISKKIIYSDLFKPCFDKSMNISNYICTNRTSATSIFEINTTLSLNTKLTESEKEKSNGQIGSNSKIEFVLDTITENKEVKVKKLTVTP